MQKILKKYKKSIDKVYILIYNDFELKERRYKKMKLTKVQKVTRFIVYTFIMLTITGILPAFILGNLYQIFGL